MDEFANEILVSRRMPKDNFFREGDAYCVIGRMEPVYDADEEELCHKTVPVFSCDVAGCLKTFTLVYEYEQHYNSVHRYVCKECKKTLPSPHLLDLHIMETHDTYFSLLSERQPMYQCFVEECSVKFSTPEERRSHCIDLHKFPPNFRYDCVKKGKSKKGQSGHKKEYKGGVTVEQLETNESVSEGAQKLPLPKSRSSCAPKAFTFGHNQEKTFAGTKSRGGKGRHWYQKKKNSNDDGGETVSSEEIPGMEELMDVLPTD